MAFDLFNRQILFYELINRGWPRRFKVTKIHLYSRTYFRMRERSNQTPMANHVGVNQGDDINDLLFRKCMADNSEYLYTEVGICLHVHDGFKTIILCSVLGHWLEQLERQRSEDPPSAPDYWFILDPKSKLDKVKLQILRICKTSNCWILEKTLLMRHTFWSCLIRCVNMKWTRRVLWKIQSGHDSVHRLTDGWIETSIPPSTLYNKCFMVVYFLLYFILHAELFYVPFILPVLCHKWQQ